MGEQRPPGGGDAVASLREMISRQDEALREAGRKQARLQEEVGALRRECHRLEACVAFCKAALELAYSAGQRDLRAQLGLVPRQERPRRSRYLSIAPSMAIAAGGIAALVTAAGIGAG